MRSVAVLYKSLPAYRIEFFNGLRSALAEHDITLDLYHGSPVGIDAAKSDTRTLPWANFRANRVVTLRGRHAVWQPVLKQALNYDLVIVEQASKLLINYPLLIASNVRSRPKLAFWGHGANLQPTTASRLSESAKRRYSRLPHWWFAYTDGTKDRVLDLGFPPDKVTVVQNAVDTRRLIEEISCVSAAEAEDMRRRYGLHRGHVGAFLGSLYPEKDLDFLVEAATLIHARDPKFSLLIGGDGPSRTRLESASRQHDFIHYLGRLDNKPKAMFLEVSDLMLMPGLVGLAILDAFAGGTPLVTVDRNSHSPEIEYLVNRRNGLKLPANSTARDYASAVQQLLADPEQLLRMESACRSDAVRYTTEVMVERFTAGVVRALETA